MAGEGLLDSKVLCFGVLLEIVFTEGRKGCPLLLCYERLFTPRFENLLGLGGEGRQRTHNPLIYQTPRSHDAQVIQIRHHWVFGVQPSPLLHFLLGLGGDDFSGRKG